MSSPLTTTTSGANSGLKKVRFSSVDTYHLAMNKPVCTNTYQPTDYCENCHSLRFNPLNKYCANCSPPVVTRSNIFQSKSDNSNGEEIISIENPARIPSFLKNTGTRSSFKSALKQSNRQSPTSNVFLNSIQQQQRSSNNSSPVLRKHQAASDDGVSIWSCYNCKQALMPGEVAISAEHVNKNARWHPHCFYCKICKELLVDLIYYHRNKDIYCQEHYNTLDSPKICAACDKPTKSEYVYAEKQYWHVEHFVCWNCENSLGGQKYAVVSSKPYCISCYHFIFAKQCNTCKQKIPPNATRLTYENLDWHADERCFKCFRCKKSLLESHFLLKDNLLFCSIECKNCVLNSVKSVKSRRQQTQHKF